MLRRRRANHQTVTWRRKKRGEMPFFHHLFTISTCACIRRPLAAITSNVKTTTSEKPLINGAERRVHALSTNCQIFPGVPSCLARRLLIPSDFYSRRRRCFDDEMRTVSSHLQHDDTQCLVCTARVPPRPHSFDARAQKAGSALIAIRKKGPTPSSFFAAATKCSAQGPRGGSYNVNRLVLPV